jgi:hypothetical protein
MITRAAYYDLDRLGRLQAVTVGLSEASTPTEVAEAVVSRTWRP